MADDPSKRGLRTDLVSTQMRTRKYLLVSNVRCVAPTKLKAAVKRAGNSAEAVERVLKASGTISA
jgi:hypothetical protein